MTRLNELFFIFIYFLIGLYVAHFFAQEFDYVDGVEDCILIILPVAFVLWPVFIVSWAIVAIVDMHNRI